MANNIKRHTISIHVGTEEEYDYCVGIMMKCYFLPQKQHHLVNMRYHCKNTLFLLIGFSVGSSQIQIHFNLFKESWI